MKNFIKNLNSLEKVSFDFIRCFFDITIAAYFLLIMQYYLHRKCDTLTAQSMIYFRETLVYIFACFSLSASLGLLLDLFFKKRKK